MKKPSKWFIYIFCVLNSISGLQIGGFTINTALVGLFMIFIFAQFIKTTKGNITINRKDTFLLYLVTASISCVLSCTYVYLLPHVSIVRGYLINCLMYIIMYLMLSNTRKDAQENFAESYVKGLIFAARIQAIWGILQVVLLYGMHININEIFFVDILHSTNTRDWIMGFYTGNVWNMRITGLNFENSMFVLVVCVGMALEKNNIWRFILFIVTFMSLSRTGWLMATSYLIILLIRKLKMINGSISSKRLLSKISLAALMLIISLSIYNSSIIVQRQINNILLRLADDNAVNLSATRHLLYYPYGILIWISDANILQKLFGYGMRVSGIAFSQNMQIASKVGIYEKFTSAWDVECDVIGLLLGGGLITFILYYITLNRLIKAKDNPFKDAIFIILIGGITYHYHTISYVVFVILIACALCKNKNKTISAVAKR